MRTRLRRLAVTAGAISLLAGLGPAAAASAASAWSLPGGRPFAGPSPLTGALVTGTLTFRGFPAGTSLTGGMGVTWSRCVTGNNGRPFTVAAGTSLDVTISVNNDLFPSFCNERASQSIWRLYISSPAPFVGAIIFTLSQSASGQPYTMECGISESGIKCQTSTAERQILVVANPSLASLTSGKRAG